MGILLVESNQFAQSLDLWIFQKLKVILKLFFKVLFYSMFVQSCVSYV